MSDEQDRQERIRRKAYQIWIEEGCPEDRAEAHWDMAIELAEIENNQELAPKPVNGASESRSPTGERIEPPVADQKAGEGEERTPASPNHKELTAPKLPKPASAPGREGLSTKKRTGKPSIKR